jgi:hypothetical protein
MVGTLILHLAIVGYPVISDAHEVPFHFLAHI